MEKKIYLPDIIGKGYKEFWNFRGRYCVCKGSRGSKKSKTTALWHIYNMMKYKDANTLVIRKTERTLKDSCYADLRWAINKLGVDNYWKCTINPLEIVYIPTGQKILFRGFDDPLKLTSITVSTGVLCWCWIEEAYEINKEENFNMLDESIRGVIPEHLFKRFTITFNPWNEQHWLKKRFFDNPNTDNKLAMTTTYKCNEWLDEQDLALFEDMRINRPKRYKVAGLGDWGIIEGVVYENWIEQVFDIEEIKKINGIETVFGLDFGYTNDPTALFCGFVDKSSKTIWVFDEFYEKGMSNEKIANKIIEMGYGKEKIVADSAEVKSIDDLYSLGLKGIRRARKGPDSVRNGINNIQSFKIIIHPRCSNFITEISNYIWDEDKFGNKKNDPVDDFNHLMDAMRYALERIIKGDTFSFD